MSVSRPTGLALALVVLLSSVGCSGARPEPLAQNLIIISIDTLRADCMSLYGYPRDTTPNIDAFA